MTKKMERLTPIVRETVGYSRDLAVEFKSKIVTPVFFLLAMTYIQDSEAYNALNDCDIIASKLRPFLEKTIFSKIEPPDTRHPLDSLPYLSDETKKVLELGVVSAREHGIQTITSASFLIGLIRHESIDIDAILTHFDVQRKDIIKSAEYYAKKNDTLEKLIKIESTGYLSQILNAFGLQQGIKMGRFTPVARQSLAVSQELAEEFKSKFITPEFMLLALTYLEGSDGYDVLNDCDIIASKLRPFLEKTMFS